MVNFRVHFGDGAVSTVAANNAAEAAEHVRKRYPGVIVNKVKVDRSGTQPAKRATRADLSALSERFRVKTLPVGFVPLYDPNLAADITETAQTQLDTIAAGFADYEAWCNEKLTPEEFRSLYMQYPVIDD